MGVKVLEDIRNLYFVVLYDFPQINQNLVGLVFGIWEVDLIKELNEFVLQDYSVLANFIHQHLRFELSHSRVDAIKHLVQLQDI